jgi:hypothetical protein
VKWSERWARIDYLQKSRGFKVAASIAVVLIAIGIFIAYIVAQNTPAAGPGGAAVQSPAQAPGQTSPESPAAPSTNPDGTPATDIGAGSLAPNTIDATKRLISDIAKARQDPTAFGVGVVVVTLIMLAVIWLGLGITYLALGTVLALLFAGVSGADWITKQPGLGWLGSMFKSMGKSGVGMMLGGIIVLTAALTALMRLLQVLLETPGVVFAIARNVQAEAVRLKVSLVFIVLLVFGLAALPLLLDADSPLRYRVQGFLQYATAISFWLIALLVVLLGVASVTYEQRDRVIWQTMTKPVAAWQYVLGKWLGVTSLGAVLLTVCAAGVFLFTEHLRSQPALGETKAFLTGDGQISEDRLILETQVLAARIARGPDMSGLIDEEQFEQNVKERIELERASNPEFPRNQAERDKIRTDLRAAVTLAYRSIEPGTREEYVFRGLKGAKEAGTPLTFRFKIDSGSNAPDQIYRLSFQFAMHNLFVQESTLGQTQSITLLPTVIDDDGTVRVLIGNGDQQTGALNPQMISFPPDGLQLSYAAGSFRGNFVRVVLVLWVKLAFLAMVAIAASTFLSFPVACLVSLGVFFIAETTPFLLQSLEYYEAIDTEGNTVLWKIPIRAISLAVGNTFRLYGEMRPTARLVEGELLPMGSMALGIMALSIATGALYAAGVAIFRRRELAIYSGH